MTRLSRYLVPACVATFVFGALFMLRDVRGKSERKAHREVHEGGLEIMSFPQGRVLTVVVDEKAVFVGEDPIAFELFGQFLRENREKLKPDYVILFGTDLASYGKVVAVYAAMHSAWMVPQTIVTRPVPLGTRFPAIKICEHYWDYGVEEEEEPNQHLRATGQGQSDVSGGGAEVSGER